MKIALPLLWLLAWLPAIAAAPAAAPTLLSAAELSHLTAILPPPPTDDSPAGRADLETLLQVQADRTPEQVARAARVVKHTPFQMGAGVFGPDFTAENLPRTAALFAIVWEQMHAANLTVKGQWARPRPSRRDARVEPCAPIPDSSSYPSGHSIHATVWAALYTAAFPERADEFEALARETRWARILGGVHFPSDTQAGWLFGQELVRLLLATPPVQAGVAEMRTEITAWHAARLAAWP